MCYSTVSTLTTHKTGHHSLNIPVSLESIKRIEILQGSGAREFGQGAFAGAINIITAPADSNNVNLSAYAAEHGLLKTNASTTLGGKKSRTFVSAGYERSDGYIRNTDFKTVNVFLHSTLKINNGELGLFAGFQDKGFGANSFYSPKYPNQFEATRVFVEGLHFQSVQGVTTYSVDAYHRLHFDRFELFRSNPASWYTNHNYHRNQIFGVKPSVQYAYSTGKTVVGMEFRSEGILSNNLGEALNKPVRVRGTDSVYYDKSDTRSLFSTYISQTFYLNNFVVAGGVQYAYNDKFGHIWTYGADLSYSFYNGLRLFASANRVYRTPTFTDLYYQGATNIGNPDLKPEFALVYEGGVKYNTRAISLQLAGFYRDGSNIIDWVKQADSTRWTTVNYTSVNSIGLDFMLNLSLSHITKLANNAMLTYSFVNSDANSGELDSYYALDYLKHNLSFSMRHNLGKSFRLSWAIRYQNRVGTYNNFATSSIRNYPDYWLCDAQLSYVNRGLKIYVDASNVFNAKYIDIANVEQPGCWCGCGVSYKFK